jgi:hypothetical protein
MYIYYGYRNHTNWPLIMHLVSFDVAIPLHTSASLGELRAFTPGKLGRNTRQRGWQYSDAVVVPLRIRKHVIYFFEERVVIRKINYEWNYLSFNISQATHLLKIIVEPYPPYCIVRPCIGLNEYSVFISNFNGQAF